MPARLRIAQIAPMEEPVPPRLYGGIERVVSTLTEQLVLQGHEVVLFASGDSRTSAELIPLCPKAVRLNDQNADPVRTALEVLSNHRMRLAAFDVLHFHTELLRFPIFQESRDRCLMTLHMQKNWPATRDLLRTCPQLPYVAISETQRRTVTGINWIGTVRHGLSPALLQPTVSPSGSYLAFLGRVSPEKGLSRAIEIARKVGMQLRIAAKVGESDRAYFHQYIEPCIDNVKIVFCGEISDVQKQEFLGNAAAMLFPVLDPEPFGLCLIEAMACGTPVIAFSLGATPEIVENNVTGFLVEDVQEAAGAVTRLQELKRETIRRRFEVRFTDARMAQEYTDVYASLARRELACL